MAGEAFDDDGIAEGWALVTRDDRGWSQGSASVHRPDGPSGHPRPGRIRFPGTADPAARMRQWVAGELPADVELSQFWPLIRPETGPVVYCEFILVRPMPIWAALPNPRRLAHALARQVVAQLPLVVVHRLPSRVRRVPFVISDDTVLGRRDVWSLCLDVDATGTPYDAHLILEGAEVACEDMSGSCARTLGGATLDSLDGHVHWFRPPPELERRFAVSPQLLVEAVRETSLPLALAETIRRPRPVRSTLGPVVRGGWADWSTRAFPAEALPDGCPLLSASHDFRGGTVRVTVKFVAVIDRPHLVAQAIASYLRSMLERPVAARVVSDQGRRSTPWRDGLPAPR